MTKQTSIEKSLNELDAHLLSLKRKKSKAGCLKDKYGDLCDIDWFNNDIKNLFFPKEGMKKSVDD